MGREYLIYAMLAVGLAAALYSRFGALLFYLWWALFRPQEWVFWVSFVWMRPSLLIGGALVIPCLLTGVLPRMIHPLGIGSLLFLATALVAHTRATVPELSWMWIDFFARILLISFLMIRLITTRRRFVLVLAVISVSLGFHSAKGGVAYLLAGGDTRYWEGLGGAFVDSAAFALAIVMILPLLLACAQNVEARWARVGFLAAIPLSCLTVIATFARTAFLALGFSALAYILLQRRRAAALAFFVAVTLVAIILVPVPKGYFERMQTIRTYRDVGETSALGRLHIWRVAWDMAVANPLGVGLRNFEPLYDTYDFSDGQYGRGRAVHNSYLQVLAENGFAGLAIYLFLLAYTYLLLFQVRRRCQTFASRSESGRFYFTMSNALIASHTAFVIGGTFLSAAHNDLTWYTFPLVAALGFLQRAEYAAATAESTAPAKEPSFSGGVHANNGLRFTVVGS